MDNLNKFKDLGNRLARGGKGAGVGAGFLLAAGGLAYGLSQSVYTVEGGHRAVIFSRLGGVQNEVYAEGLHFRIPWFHYPIIFDIRAKPRKFSSPTGSKDLQTINLALRILSRPDSDNLPTILRTLGNDYDERVLPSVVNEVLKGVVAKFNANQLITQRQQVSLLIRKELTDRARDFNIIVDDVAITELSFSPEYMAAVEAKQVAQQEAQRAQFVVERAKQERQQKIVQAEGEAAAVALVGQAVSKNPGYLKLRRLAAAQNISKLIAESGTKAYLDSSTLLLSINSDNVDSRIDAAMGMKKH